MADTWTDRVKDFAYQHGPEWLQKRMESREMDRMADEEYKLYGERVAAGFYKEPDDARPTPVIAQRQTQPDMIGVEDIAKRGDIAESLNRAASARTWASWQDPGSDSRDQAVERARNLIDHARNIREARAPSWHEEYAKGTGMGEARDDEILRKYSAAIHRPGEVDAVPLPHQPTKTVDYIETHRYHDKHFRKGPTFEVRGPNDRQQSWTWER